MSELKYCSCFRHGSFLALPLFLLLFAFVELDGGSMPGERADYRLRWSFATVGSCRIEVLAGHQGSEDAVFRLTASSLPWMDPILRVRTRIESAYLRSPARSVHYRRTEQADRSPDHNTALFDLDAGTVRFVKGHELRVPSPVEKGIQDPLSIVFYFREKRIDQPEGYVWEVPLTDGRDLGLARVELLRRETIKVPAGRFQAILLEADFGPVRAVFQRPDGALIRVWLSDDEKKIPLRLESSLLIGSFNAQLESLHPYSAETLSSHLPRGGFWRR